MLLTLDSFPEADFNTRPDTNSWSAGQVAEHLIKSEVGTLRFFDQGRSAERDSEAKINPTEERFLYNDHKLPAPNILRPDNKPKIKHKVIDKLQDTRQKLISMIEIENLSEIITGLDHPIFGPLIRVEWLYFTIIHAQRHIHQIKTIKTQL